MGKVTRRDFIVKGGKYALFTTSAMQVLFTSKRAMAQSGLAGFKVDVENPEVDFILSGTPSTSPTGTWNGSGSYVTYDRYTIDFVWDTDHLPDPVPVTVTWQIWSNPAHGSQFRWDNGNSNSGIRHFDIPKSGGSLGLGGTVSDFHVSRPMITNSDDAPHTGTVTFTATGVQTLTISVVMPGR